MKPIPLDCDYRNKKTGKVYFAFGLVENQTNDQAGQAMVSYRSREDGERKVYVREVQEFLEKFERVVLP